MYVIKRVDTDQYFMEWSWQDNPWDGKQYDQLDAECGADFFGGLNIPCVVEFIE